MSKAIENANKAAIERKNNPRKRNLSQLVQTVQARDVAMAEFNAALEKLELFVQSL